MHPAELSDGAGCEPYCADNFFDRLSSKTTLDLHYEHMFSRERDLVDQRLALEAGDVLSVGCGWHPGRHLFPAPAFRIVAVAAAPDLGLDLYSPQSNVALSAC